jgi:hypothetical protein
MSALNPAPFSRLATASVRGLVGTAAQTFGGPKTFANPVTIDADGANGTTFSNPILRIKNNALNQNHLFQIGGLASNDWQFAIGYYGGAGSPVISSRAGPIYFSMAAGSHVSPFSPGNADLGSVTNYWRDLWLNRDLQFRNAGQSRILFDGGGANHWEIRGTPGSELQMGNNTVTYFGLRSSDGYAYSQYGFEVNPTGLQALVKVWGSARVDQRGLDRRAVTGNDSPGNFPMGINRLAAGATTCTITTSLVGTASHVEITWLGDPGARHWVTLAAGSFTVNLSAAPAGNVDFSWRVSGLL